MKMRAKSFQGSTNHPSSQETIELDTVAVRIGFMGFVFGVVMYALMIYLSIIVLEWQEIISFTIEWPAALALSTIYIFSRSLDRVFFRR